MYIYYINIYIYIFQDGQLTQLAQGWGGPAMPASAFLPPPRPHRLRPRGCAPNGRSFLTLTKTSPEIRVGVLCRFLATLAECMQLGERIEQIPNEGINEVII